MKKMFSKQQGSGMPNLCRLILIKGGNLLLVRQSGARLSFFFRIKQEARGLFVTILKKSEEQGFKKVLATVKNKKKTSLLLKERSYYSNFFW